MASDVAKPSRTNTLQRLFALASELAGYFTSKQAHELGYTARSLVHHVAAGHFQRVSRGFYRLASVPASPHEKIAAAWVRLASRHAVVSHETAMALHGLSQFQPTRIHLTLPRARRAHLAGRTKAL